MADLPPMENALSQLPVMPEEYDRFENKLAPHARAFGAGVVDPAGIPSWLLNLAATHPKGPWADYDGQHNQGRLGQFSDWYMRRMQELRDESPVAAGAGSAVIPALLAGPFVGGPLLGAGSAAEAMTVVPPVVGIGSAVGKIRGVVDPPAKKQRPQASYPPGGAY